MLSLSFVPQRKGDLVTAIVGTVIMTLTDEVGNPMFTTYEFYNPTTFALEDRAQATSRGSRTGAVVIDNQTGRPQKLRVGASTINVSTNGSAYTVADLATQGFTTIQDLAGLTPELT
jgi:hypothetical protein